MKLSDLLLEKRERIVKKWLKAVTETYPPETAAFFQKGKDKFSNPVGAAYEEALGPLFDELRKGGDTEKLASLVSYVIRIRAVQDFSPSQALQIVFLLKDVIRKELKSDLSKGKLALELLDFETRVDRFAALAFDIYVECRERVWKIKMDEFMQRPGLVSEQGMCLSYLLRRGRLQENPAEKLE